MGVLSMRLLRPLHPFFAYAASHARGAAVPLADRAADRGRAAAQLGRERADDRAAAARAARAVDRARVADHVRHHVRARRARVLDDADVGDLQLLLRRCARCSPATCCRSTLLPRFPIVADAREVAAVPITCSSAPVELMTKHARRRRSSPTLIAWPARVGRASCVAVALWVWRAGVRRFEAVGG